MYRSLFGRRSNPPPFFLVRLVFTVGNDDRGAETFDWEVSAEVLFERQRASVGHQRSATHHKNVGFSACPVHASVSANHLQKQSVTVPNFVARGGLSLRFPIAELSIGKGRIISSAGRRSAPTRPKHEPIISTVPSAPLVSAWFDGLAGFSENCGNCSFFGLRRGQSPTGRRSHRGLCF